MGRVLGLDLGERRIGLAWSDENRIVVVGGMVLTRKDPASDIEVIRKKIEELNVTVVVLGKPLHMSGESGEKATEAEEFKRSLEEGEGDLEIVLWDERLTTVMAERSLIESGMRRSKRKKVIDKVAASIILQSWLDAGQTDNP